MNIDLSWLSRQSEGNKYLLGYLFISTKNNDLFGFISNMNNIQEVKENKKIFLTEQAITQIMEQDETFGALVGGEFLYFAMPIIIEALKVFQVEDKIYLDKNSIIILYENDDTQKILI